MSRALAGGVRFGPTLQIPAQTPRMSTSRLSSLSRFRQALCSSAAAVGRTQATAVQASASNRGMAVRASRLKDREDAPADIGVEQKVCCTNGTTHF